MQKPEKSCSQCRARKTKCDLTLPRCSSCRTRNLPCQFGPRRKPGPLKGFKRQARLRNGGRHPQEGQCQDGRGSQLHGRRTCSEVPVLSKTPSPVTDFDDKICTPFDNLGTKDQSPDRREPAAQSTKSFDVLQILKDQLLDAYSDIMLFPYLPQVGKSQLLDAEKHDTLGSALIDAVCAMSAHFAPSSIFQDGLISQTKAAEMYNSRARSAYLCYTREEDHCTNLTVVKLAVLLATYEMNCSRGLKGWFMVGEAVRMAYDMRLDQLDSKSHLTSAFMSPDEAEDARYLWWSIYSLDTYASSTLMRPFGITSKGINTVLVSTPEDDFKLGKVYPTNDIFLPSNPIDLQMMVISLDHSHPLSTQTFCLLVLSLGRLITDMRREQLDAVETGARSDLLRNTLATMRFSLPDNYLDFQTSIDHPEIRQLRIQAVLLLTLQSLCLHSYPPAIDTSQQAPPDTRCHEYVGGDDASPTYSNDSDACIQDAFAMVEVVRSLSARDFSRLSPTMGAIFWLPALTLVLHQKSCTSPAERESAASGVEVLKAALKKLGGIWAIARKFHDALLSLNTLATNTTTALQRLQPLYVLQSYSSPMVSVSCGSNNIHIPYELELYRDGLWDLQLGFMRERI